jgi:hypothetical protein
MHPATRKPVRRKRSAIAEILVALSSLYVLP